MTSRLQDDFHLHFETRAQMPAVFRMTEPLIVLARAQSGLDVRTSFGEDLQDLSWLEDAVGLVTSNDVLCDTKFPLRNLSKAAKQLRWIHIIGAGIEPLLPFDWLPPHIVLTNNSGVHFDKARESATMVLLMLNAQLPAVATNQRKAVWNQIFTSTIKGRTVLIVGVGDMGTAIASAARDLGMRVIGVRRSATPHSLFDHVVPVESLDAVLPEADFVVLAAPLTKETQNLIDRRRIGLMKRGAGLFNMGRAGLLDHEALIEALRAGALSGAVLDVFETKPLPARSPLWHIENLILTPHVTSDDLDRYLPKTFELVFDNARRLAHGEPLMNVVDPARGY